MVDAELSERFERLETVVRQGAAQTNERFERLETLVRQETGELRAHISIQTAETREYTDLRAVELRERLDAQAAETREYVDLRTTEKATETRHHMDVVAERLTQDIRLVAEGQQAMRADVICLKDGQKQLLGRQEQLELRQQALEYRQERLEQRQGMLELQQVDLGENQKALVTEVRLVTARRMS